MSSPLTDELPRATPPKVEPIPPRYWWLKRITAGVLVLLLIAAGVRWWWGYHASKVLDAEVDRCLASGLPFLPEDFDSDPVPNEQNAVPLLEQAWKALTLTPEQVEMVDQLVADAGVVPRRLRDAQMIHDATAEARELLHRALLRPGTDWGIRYRTPAIKVDPPLMLELGGLFKAAMVSALYQHQVGDSAAAVSTLRDILGVSRRLEMRPTLFSYLAATAAVKAVRTALEEIGPSLVIASASATAGATTRPARRSQVQALIGDLLDEEGWWKSRVIGFCAERMEMYDTAKLVISGGEGWNMAALAGGILYEPFARLSAFLYRPMLQLNAAQLLSEQTSRVEAAQERTWPACRERQQSPARRESNSQSRLRIAARLLSVYLAPAFCGLLEDTLAHLARRRMAATALAIRLFELDHGRRPERLEMLVPRYLPRVPDDPFAREGTKLHYDPDAARPLLYSVCVNRIDERGAFDPADDAWLTKDLPFYLDGLGSRRPTTGKAPRRRQHRLTHTRQK